MLVEFKRKDIELWIITEADVNEVCSRLQELDREEDGSFCWSDCFEGRVVQALPAELSPAHTKGVYLQKIVQDFPSRAVIYFDDNSSYSNLGMLSPDLISIGVIAADVTNTDFRNKVEALFQADGMVLNLGLYYSRLFEILK